MVRAYILIEMVAGHSRNLVSKLRSRPGVRSVDRVTGPYDVVVVMEAEDINKISEMVTREVHSVQGVVRTLTCIALGNS